jgi:hypothetical protein
MSPEDLAVVTESWEGIQGRRNDLADRLVVSYGTICPPEAAELRAHWLVDAVAELVDLLTAPSQLALRARELAQTLPCPGTTPTFLLDGNAWMSAARDISPTWSGDSEHAWRQAWLLLSDVLAIEALSPFTGP